MKLLDYVDDLNLLQIDHQSTSTKFDELVKAVHKLRSADHEFAYTRGPASQKEADRKVIEKSGIEATVKKIFNIRLSLTVAKDSDVYAHVMVPEIDPNNVLVEDWMRKHMSAKDTRRRLDKIQKKYVLGVDLEEGKLTGEASDEIADVWLGEDLIHDARMTDEEVTAILCHELGHFMTYMMFLGKTAMISICLAQLHHAYTDSVPRESRVEILKVVSETTDLKDFDIERAADHKNGVTTTTAVVASMVLETPNLTRTKGYDRRTFEMLSDQFVSRLGAGDHLSSGLAKLYNGEPMPPIDMWSLPIYLLLIPIILFLIAMAVMYAPLIALILIFTTPRDTYDRPRARIERIRRDTINAMKVRRIGPARRKDLNRKLESINDSLALMEKDKGLMNKIERIISPKRYRYYNTEESMQELEAIMNNELFARANALGAL